MMDKREAYVMYGDTQIRPSVMHFAAHMERVLEANEYKGGWLKMSDVDVINRIGDENDELDQAVQDRLNASNCDCNFCDSVSIQVRTSMVVKEAIDVANYAMMLIDPDRIENQTDGS